MFCIFCGDKATVECPDSECACCEKHSQQVCQYCNPDKLEPSTDDAIWGFIWFQGRET
jgi:hypothetical protein